MTTETDEQRSQREAFERNNPPRQSGLANDPHDSRDDSRNFNTRVDVQARPDSEINPITGLPHTVSLGAVLARIRLAPHEIATLLGGWGANHDGTPQADLGPKLRSAAQAVTNPVSYGADAPAPQPVVTPVSQPTFAAQPASFDLKDHARS